MPSWHHCYSSFVQWANIFNFQKCYGVSNLIVVLLVSFIIDNTRLLSLWIETMDLKICQISNHYDIVITLDPSVLPTSITLLTLYDKVLCAVTDFCSYLFWKMKHPCPAVLTDHASVISFFSLAFPFVMLLFIKGPQSKRKS